MAELRQELNKWETSRASRGAFTRESGAQRSGTFVSAPNRRADAPASRSGGSAPVPHRVQDGRTPPSRTQIKSIGQPGTASHRPETEASRSRGGSTAASHDAHTKRPAQVVPRGETAEERNQITQTFRRPPHLRRPTENGASKQASGTAPGQFDTSLNWRHVAEPGEQGTYKSPQFRGAAREYVPKRAPVSGAPRRPSSAQTGMGSILEQTPARRRERSKQNRRRKLENLHRENYRRQFRIVKKKRRPRSFYIAVVCLTLACYLVFAGGMAAVFAGNLFRRTLQDNGSVTYVFGTSKNTGYAKVSLRYGSAFRDGMLMINMNRIAALCDLTMTGDLDQVRFYSRGEAGDEVLFYTDSHTAVINGTPVTLSGKSVMIGDSVYVPMDFFERFVSGLELKWEEERSRLTVTRIVVSTSVLKGDSYAELTFGLHKDQAVPEIVFDDLALELRMRIEADYEQSVVNPGGFDDPTVDSTADSATAEGTEP